MAGTAKEAMFARNLEGGRVECQLCPHGCMLREGLAGRCGVRVVEGGELRTANYAMVTSASIDPIEKKPLYHFMPGSGILSVGTFGCNMGCDFCQNWEISQARSGGQRLEPKELAALAERYRSRSVGVAYTYSEPSVWYEYVFDSAQLIKELGLKSVLVTNGFINPEPLAALLPYVDAMNIDLKAMDDGFYQRVCKARLRPVLDAISQAVEAGCHVELTTLVVPGLNDSTEEMRRLAQWVAELSRSIPLHISRYFPDYRMDQAPTPIGILVSCAETAREHLDYVYIGNAALPEWRDTTCHACGAVLIERQGYAPPVVHLEGQRCPKCGAQAAVVLG